MPIHDAVGINCKNGATTENQGAWSSIWAKGQVYGLRGTPPPRRGSQVYGLDMTTPPWWREKVVVYYYYIGVKR